MFRISECSTHQLKSASLYRWEGSVSQPSLSGALPDRDREVECRMFVGKRGTRTCLLTQACRPHPNSPCFCQSRSPQASPRDHGVDLAVVSLQGNTSHGAYLGPIGSGSSRNSSRSRREKRKRKGAIVGMLFRRSEIVSSSRCVPP